MPKHLVSCQDSLTTAGTSPRTPAQVQSLEQLTAELPDITHFHVPPAKAEAGVQASLAIGGSAATGLRHEATVRPAGVRVLSIAHTGNCRSVGRS